MLSILLGIMFPVVAFAAQPAYGAMTETPDSEAGFLDQLGQRVRTMRALRGMSRKVLAKVSGISERYIAQLESGKGNVSIVLLRRVSNAMGAHLEDLIPSTEPAPLMPRSAEPSLSRRSLPNLCIIIHMNATVSACCQSFLALCFRFCAFGANFGFGTRLT